MQTRHLSPFRGCYNKKGQHVCFTDHTRRKRWTVKVPYRWDARDYQRRGFFGGKCYFIRIGSDFVFHWGTISPLAPLAPQEYGQNQNIYALRRRPLRNATSQVSSTVTGPTQCDWKYNYDCTWSSSSCLIYWSWQDWQLLAVAMLSLQSFLNIPKGTRLVVDNALSPRHAVSTQKRSGRKELQCTYLQNRISRWTSEPNQTGSSRPVIMRSRSMTDLFSMQNDNFHHNPADGRLQSKPLRLPARRRSPPSRLKTRKSIVPLKARASYPGTLPARRRMTASQLLEVALKDIQEDSILKSRSLLVEPNQPNHEVPLISVLQKVSNAKLVPSSPFCALDRIDPNQCHGVQFPKTQDFSNKCQRTPSSYVLRKVLSLWRDKMCHGRQQPSCIV